MRTHLKGPPTTTLKGPQLQAGSSSSRRPRSSSTAPTPGGPPRGVKGFSPPAGPRRLLTGGPGALQMSVRSTSSTPTPTRSSLRRSCSSSSSSEQLNPQGVLECLLHLGRHPGRGPLLAQAVKGLIILLICLLGPLWGPRLVHAETFLLVGGAPGAPLAWICIFLLKPITSLTRTHYFCWGPSCLRPPSCAVALLLMWVLSSSSSSSRSSSRGSMINSSNKRGICRDTRCFLVAPLRLG